MNGWCVVDAATSRLTGLCMMLSTGVELTMDVDAADRMPLDRANAICAALNDSAGSNGDFRVVAATALDGAAMRTVAVGTHAVSCALRKPDAVVIDVDVRGVAA